VGSVPSPLTPRPEKVNVSDGTTDEAGFMQVIDTPFKAHGLLYHSA